MTLYEEITLQNKMEGEQIGIQKGEQIGIQKEKIHHQIFNLGIKSQQKYRHISTPPNTATTMKNKLKNTPNPCHIGK